MAPGTAAPVEVEREPRRRGWKTQFRKEQSRAWASCSSSPADACQLFLSPKGNLALYPAALSAAVLACTWSGPGVTGTGGESTGTAERGAGEQTLVISLPIGDKRQHRHDECMPRLLLHPTPANVRTQGGGGDARRAVALALRAHELAGPLVRGLSSHPAKLEVEQVNK